MQSPSQLSPPDVPLSALEGIVLLVLALSVLAWLIVLILRTSDREAFLRRAFGSQAKPTSKAVDNVNSSPKPIRTGRILRGMSANVRRDS
jgi:hypothetical protein